MMLFHCLYDSDWIIIWIAFNWQDFNMFALGSSVSSLIQFWTFPGIYYFLLNQKVFFLEKEKAIWMQTSSLHLSALHIQPEQSRYNRPSKRNDYLVPLSPQIENARHNTPSSEGRATSRNAARCVLKISSCWVVIPPAQSEVARCVRLKVVSQRLSSAPSLDVTLISL